MTLGSGRGYQKHAGLTPASQNQLDFRPHSPLLWRGTMPARPSNGFFNPRPDPLLAFALCLTLLCPESSMQRERESPRKNMESTDAEKDAFVEQIDQFTL